MANDFLPDAVRTQKEKVVRIVGNAARHQHPVDKAEQYRQDENLDPLTLPSTSQGIGP